MKLRGTERVIKLYPLWTIPSIIVLYFLLKSPYHHYLLWLVLFLIFKDIFIDVLPKKGPTPNWFDHAPFVIIISIIGLLDYFGANPFTGLNPIPLLTTILAIVDSFIDVWDDLTYQEPLRAAPVQYSSE